MSNENELEAVIRREAMHDGQYAIAYGLLRCAFWLKYLGGGDNADTRGAVEFLAVKVGEVANAIELLKE